MSTAADSTPPVRDFVDELAGLAPHGAVSALRAARADATGFTQGSYDALFDPRATGLSLDERLAAASYAAHLSSAPLAAQAYRERLAAQHSAHRTEALALLDQLLTSDAFEIDTAAGSGRLAVILAHTRALALLDPHPDQAALLRLKDAKLSTAEIVALSQLVAFISYQVRVVAALRALEATA